MSAGETVRPNIFYIMADDHASSAISAYGSYRNTTPHLDRIAEGGIRLDGCFCTNSICTPSRASILTGKYPHIHGAITFNPPDPSHVTFPQLLRNAGYYTAMIGKWHLLAEPVGFSHWAVLPGQGDYFDPGFIIDGVATRESGYVTDIITDKTIQALENRPKEKPFCILCHHKAPHDPWLSDEAHNSLYQNGDLAEPPTLFDTYENRATCLKQSTQVIGSESPGHTFYEQETAHLKEPVARRKAQYQEYIKRYLRCIASIDDNVGRILDYLDREKLTENTIVVYTSDQGFFLGEHGWYDKRFMYEESLQMPFLVRYPREIPAASSNDNIVLNVDFAPTFLDFAGVAVPDDMQGRSFRSILSGQPPSDWRQSMYYRYYKSHFNTPSHWGVRTSRYKYIHYGASDEHELFDLQSDPEELSNVWKQGAYRSVAADMKAEVERLRGELMDTEDALSGDIRSLRLLAANGHPMHR